ncbi:hypothetical protein C8Q80DRAFT_1217329 [Daedaleopsis nitida]|nr:hypothetical protein C8Q80DRAFT_1217329 [Daedaleopsis nitida]
MHNLFLGELRHHCREFWAIDIKDKSSDSKKIPAHSPQEQQVWLETVVKLIKLDDRNSAFKKFAKVRKGYIAAVVELNDVALPSSGFTKRDYIEVLLDWWERSKPKEIQIPPVFDESTRDFHLVHDQHDISRFRILDQATLAQIRADIMATSLPSWIGRVPKNFGSPSHGKLKADQWCTACQVNLLISLVRRWGDSSATPRQKTLLNNFLDLVRAVDLATRRTMDEERAEKFDRYMQSYLTSLTEIFQHNLVPNHHLSLHLYECLILFGPIHAWWAFPFERYNGIIQNLNTNDKTNDMPLTFMRYFYIGANLRWLMSTTTWPDNAPFRAMMDSYKKTFRDAARSDPRLASINAFGEETAPVLPEYSESDAKDLPRDIYDALLSRITDQVGPYFSSVFNLSDRRPGLPDSANNLRRFEHGGVRFGTQNKQKRNSFITFHLPNTGRGETPRAGQIREILLHLRVENGRNVLQPFFVVDEYVPLSDAHAALDPFRKFDNINTWLFHDEFARTPRVLALEDIQAHFAAFVYTPTDIGRKCMVVQSLDRDSACAAATIPVLAMARPPSLGTSLDPNGVVSTS